MQSLNFKLTPIRYMEIWHDKGFNAEYPVTAVSISGSYTLNPITSMIWRLLDGNHSIEAIIQKLRDLFPDAGKEQIENDVVEVLLKLHGDDLINLNYTPLNPNRELNSLQAYRAMEL